MPSKNSLTGVWCNCEVCGTLTYKTPYQYKTKKHHFCSTTCSGVFHHLQHSDRVPCEFCGKEFVKRRSTTQRFCSIQCQHEWQKTNVGERNARYTRVKHKCDYCGKEHIVKAYKINNTNLFCSKECRQEWYASVWSQQSEWRAASRDRAVRILAEGLVSNTNTQPQRVVDELLDGLGIEYQREFTIGTYSIDNYLCHSNLCLEVMGDYWHTSPMIYERAKYHKQEVAIKRDILKREQVREYTGYSPLYLWEYDIRHNPDLCKELIGLFIRNEGKLENYHSFNYSLNDKQISLNKDIIVAFQDLSDPDLLSLPNA